MKKGMTFAAALAEYERLFGEEPDSLWLQGDFERFQAMIEKAIAEKKPLPDYYKAHGIPDGALV